jgi:hypothetical protein
LDRPSSRTNILILVIDEEAGHSMLHNFRH